MVQNTPHVLKKHTIVWLHVHVCGGRLGGGVRFGGPEIMTARQLPALRLDSPGPAHLFFPPIFPFTSQPRPQAGLFYLQDLHARM